MSWLNPSSLGLTLGVLSKTYRKMTNRLKLKVKKFEGRIAACREVTREVMEDRGLFGPLILNRVKAVRIS